MADEVDDINDLVKRAKAEGKMQEGDEVIDAATKKLLEEDDVKVIERKDIFSEIKEVDKYFSNGFLNFVLLYKPKTLNDFYDKLESFAKI